MEYKFKFKPDFNKPTVKETINQNLSDFILHLYQNATFQKLKLNRNKAINSYLENKYILEKSLNVSQKVPQNNGLIPYSFVFSDVIDVDYKEDVKQACLSINSKFASNAQLNLRQKHRYKDINSTFSQIGTHYKGSIQTFDLLHHDLELLKFDLIAKISYNVISGENGSHFIMTYSIKPSEKFMQLFNELLVMPVEEQVLFPFRTLIDVFGFGQTGNYSSRKYIYVEHKIKKLFQELDYQLKTFLHQNNLKAGVFNAESKYLFPMIVVYSYEDEEFQTYRDTICKNLGLRLGRTYTSQEGNSIFHMPYSNLSNNAASTLSLFYANKDSVANENSILQISKNHIESLLPFWLLINIGVLYETKIVQYRQQIFNYIKRNQDSTFLKKTTELKNKLIPDKFIFNQIVKDFLTPANDR